MPLSTSASVHKKYGRSRHVKYCFDSKCLRAKVLPCTRMYSRLATCTSAALTARVYYDTECFRAQNIILRDKKSAYAHQCVSHTRSTAHAVRAVQARDAFAHMTHCHPGVYKSCYGNTGSTATGAMAEQSKHKIKLCAILGRSMMGHRS